MASSTCTNGRRIKGGVDLLPSSSTEAPYCLHGEQGRSVFFSFKESINYSVTPLLQVQLLSLKDFSRKVTDNLKGSMRVLCIVHVNCAISTIH